MNQNQSAPAYNPQFDAPAPRFETFRRAVEKLLDIRSLDGDEERDGYSLDSAYEAWRLNVSPREYVAGRRV